MTREDFEGKLIVFINMRLLPKGSRHPVARTTPLFADGLINSMRILHLLAFIEKTLRVRISEESIVMENFATPEHIAKVFVPEAYEPGSEK